MAAAAAAAAVEVEVEVEVGMMAPSTIAHQGLFRCYLSV